MLRWSLWQVSIPNGSIKSHHRVNGRCAVGKFQFQMVQLKARRQSTSARTQMLFQFQMVQLKVSGDVLESVKNNSFQFQMVQLKENGNKDLQQNAPRFQFQMVQLKVELYQRAGGTVERFQFQMVQLKDFHQDKARVKFVVSIPNGSIKRLLSGKISMSPSFVSIPNGSIKSMPQPNHFGRATKFQFQMVQLKGIRPGTVRIDHPQFQFQMVQLKGILRFDNEITFSSFNSKWFN